MKPGDKVAIIAGRHRGSKGVLVKIDDTAGPSGAYYRIAIVKRPRAGDTAVFESEIVPIEPEP